MENKKPYNIKTINEFHQLRDLPKPKHPLISVIDFSDIKSGSNGVSESVIQNFYSISLKRSTNSKMIYGQQEYDFDSGVLFFLSPNQVFNVNHSEKKSGPHHTGRLLLVHPDFIWNTTLAKTIKQYQFFDYAVNEALFLSDDEEKTLNAIIGNIQKEYNSNIDAFSQSIIISQIETLLNYSERFYQRQFITRKKLNHQILERLEKLLTDYFNGEDLISKGLPTVQYVAEKLNVSPGYLGSLLRALIGQNTQQYIHNKLIEKAKEKLSTTNLSVSEVAYELGFEHLQSFSKLFKAKTNVSPLAFRQSFN